METREALEKRVADLEKQLGILGGGPDGFLLRGVRKRAAWGIGDIPAYDIALGPDLERGELRGHAKGIVAIGDIATGFLALGGLARGVIAVGGGAAGLVSFGGMSLGILAAIGGLAIGSLAIGGAAVGGVAMGGAALGHYACGGAAAGTHAVGALGRDPVAEEFFREHGMARLCR